MGLLTDPSAGQGKLMRILMKRNPQLFVFFYLCGLVYFYVLAMNKINNETYFSENALLPGLVMTEYNDARTPVQYHEELLDEMKKYKNAIPYPWIQAKMRQIGLETYTHSFTLHSPLSNRTYSGKNVYGIIRAPRASSTEALVLSAPFRPPESPYDTTAPSIAIMLSFAKFAYKGKHWAKDIIILITEHEQLGMQAWLEAYHGVTCGSPGVLDHGDLKGRAGAIQAAINLEFHDVAIQRMELKIEGLNGQLPNLDLFNLVARLCIKEMVKHTFKDRFYRDLHGHTAENFETMFKMVKAQATGMPTGNHGLFFRFGIQAITLEGHGHRQNIYKAYFDTQGRLLEGIFRSLNNLLERFHQSFFFYLLCATDRFISIGLYMPAICLLIAGLFIKGYAKWCELHQNPLVENGTDEERSKYIDYIDPKLGCGKKPKNLSLTQWEKEFEKESRAWYSFHHKELRLDVLTVLFIAAHCFGIFAKFMPTLLFKYTSDWNYSSEELVFYGFAAYSFVLLFLPLTLRSINFRTMAVLNIFALLELGTALLCISMYNISLAMCLAVVSAPVAYLIYPTSNRVASVFQKSIFLLVHPFVALNIMMFKHVYENFGNEEFRKVIERSLKASQDALTYSIVDSEIYGNWLFSVMTIIFFSNWLCFWVSSFAEPALELDEKTLEVIGRNVKGDGDKSKASGKGEGDVKDKESVEIPKTDDKKKSKSAKKQKSE